MSPSPHVPISPHARLVVCDPDLCVGCQLCEFACASVKDNSSKPRR